MYDDEFNTSGYPLAYLFTFRCYGTWLPGDSRGTVTKYHNAFGSPYFPPDREWRNRSKEAMKGDPVALTGPMRAAVKAAILETCAIRHWELFALNVRTNHVHCVISVGEELPSRVLSALKANATRLLRERQLVPRSQTVWVARGSKRYLWNENALWKAIDYVMEGQGGDLPEF